MKFWKFIKNINLKLALVYVTMALLCAGFVFLMQSLFSDFQKQKEEYQHNKTNLLEINDLVSQFYNLQEYANLFLAQKNMRYLHTYQMQIDTFQQKLEQVVHFMQHEKENSYLEEIMLLFREKRLMLKKLQNLFANRKDIDYIFNNIAEKIEEEISRNEPQTEVFTTLLRDTIWQEPQSFGKRLKEAFRSNKKRGNDISSVNTVIITDTIITQQWFDPTSLLDSVYQFMQQYQDQHTTQIERIEIELYALLTADQFINREIINLLLQLHEYMLLNIISLGEEYENNAHNVLKWSAIACFFALLLITAFVIFIFNNLKTIRKTHEALALEKLKTEELMEHRHQLLLAISHDVKTPLNAILGYLELWENENLPPKQLRELNVMQYSGKYISALLNNLLEFARLEQQKTQIHKEIIEIVPFFMEIMEMFQPLCNEKKNKLTYHIDIKEHPQIFADPLKLKQIIVNLISNAVKYTSEGNIDVRIEEIYEPQLQLKITVSDTGKGIPKEKIETLFEPFTRVEKNSAGIEGSGLGLFVVKGLIELMKGNIELQTEENKGVKVTFSIPFETVLTDIRPVMQKMKPLKIWVIEDDATQLQVIVYMLQKLGHTAITSKNKTEFEKQVDTYCNTSLQPPCDIVFTDLEMGDLNGYEVLEKIKSISHIPVICFSGNVGTLHATPQQQFDFDGFLEKPFTLSQLEKILLTVLTQKTYPAFSLFSLHTLNEMFGNDQVAINDLLQTFSDSLQRDIQKFETAVTEGNLFLAQQTAHRILPFCKQIHANEVIPFLEKIELSKNQHKVHFKDFRDDIVRLINHLRQILHDVQRMLERT